MRIDFKVVDKSCVEFSMVSKVFNERIAKLYGSQAEALQKIGESSDRLCEMLFVDSEPKGIIVYKKALQDDKALELKTLCLLEPDKESKKGYGTILLDRVMESAARRKADQVLVTVSSESGALRFFERNGFNINQKCSDKYIHGTVENILTRRVERKSPEQERSVSVSQRDLPAPILFSAPKQSANTSRAPDLTCTLRREYIQAISSGSKTFEGRVATHFFSSYTPGKIVQWNAGPHSVMTEIVSRKQYPSFESMLRDVDYKKFVPEARSFEEAKRLYDNIPGYSEKAKRFGVLSLELKVIAPVHEQRYSESAERQYAQSRDRSDFSKSYDSGSKRKYSDDRYSEEREYGYKKRKF